MQNTWINEIEQNIDNQKANIYYRDLRFYQVDRFIKMAKLIDEYSSHCAECKNNKEIVGDVAKDFGLYLGGNLSRRKQYERHYDSIDKHLKKIHGHYAPQYFLSLYSFAGMVFGILPGALFYFLSPGNWVYYLSVCVMVSVFIARQFGKKKDNIIKKAGKLL